MQSVRKSVLVPYAAEQMYELVNRVDLYPEFLPWCGGTQVIEEKRATYACVPGLARPAAGRVAERVYLAGDHTYGDFPATLEAAVRSGRIAAAALSRDCAAAAAARDSIRAP